MKKLSYSPAAIALLGIAAACTPDATTSLGEAAMQPITYTVTAENASRSLTCYQNGTDISSLSVSAWLLNRESGSTVGDTQPDYDAPCNGNAAYFTEDVLTRPAGSGVFSYTSDARYWPASNQPYLLSFFSVVDNDRLPGYATGEGHFQWYNEADKEADRTPGLDWILQHDPGEMPDLLQAQISCVVNSGASWSSAQRNVTLSFTHTLSKVIVKARVDNPDLRIYITDACISNLVDKGRMIFPDNRSGSTALNTGEARNATWRHEADPARNVTINAPILLSDPTTLDSERTLLTVPGVLILDTATDAGAVDGIANPEGDKIAFNREDDAANQPAVSYAMPEHTVIGGDMPEVSVVTDGTTATMAAGQNHLLAIPFDYSAYCLAHPDAAKPCIKLTCRVYDKTSGEFDPEVTDVTIPIPFSWKAGTVNTYTIRFDKLSVETTDSGINDATAPIAIGCEVSIKDWATGQEKTVNY